jgi:predicted ribosome quality control (RQC) complex YloA/Tae2 family protein
MDNFYLNEIVEEIAPVLIGRRLTRAALEGSDLRLDFGGARFGLVARLTGQDPALFLASEKRRKPDSRLSAGQPEQARRRSAHQLLLQVQSKLVGAGVSSIVKNRYDRVVSLTLTPPDGSGVRGSGFRLILSLTGRSANVLLVGLSGLVEAALKETGPIQIGNPPPPQRPDAFDPHALLALAGGRDLTSNEILDSCIGPSSPFTNLYRREFLCRCSMGSPSKALQTLVEDLFRNRRKPIIYSSVSVDDVPGIEIELGQQPLIDGTVSQRPAKLTGARSCSGGGAEIILSCIELALAKGMQQYDFATFSEAAEIYSESIAAARAHRERYVRLKNALETRLKKLRSALRSIESDLAGFAEADTFKRFGDLLLANLNDARVEGTVARVKDYYNSDQPEIEIEINEDLTLQQAAAAYYEKYQKARRAVKILAPRAHTIGNQISKTEDLLASLPERADLHRIEEVESLAGFGPQTKGGVRAGTGIRGAPAKSQRGRRAKGAEIGRRFLSSDGYEIVVGRNDAENDAITFRVAGSLDIWLHAADYPGSHVIVRNPTRRPIPQRTIIEAARIAAFYSQARRQGKTAVNYTQKKLVSKPPKAKPGLVRLSGYKTLVVEPSIPPALDETNRTF